MILWIFCLNEAAFVYIRGPVEKAILEKLNMKKQLIIYFLFYMSSTGYVYAQWTSKDSLWLKNVLAGKDTIRLNIETMKSIQEGHFLNQDKPLTPMLSVSPELPVVKDFSEYIQWSDSLKRKMALKDLPPSVFWLTGPKDMADFTQPVLEINPAFFMVTPGALGKPVPRGQSFDFMGAIAYVFSKEYRQKAKNQKQATSWKYYNSLPENTSPHKQRNFRTVNPELVLPLVKSNAKKKDSLAVAIIGDSLSTNRSSFWPDSIAWAIPADSLGEKILLP